MKKIILFLFLTFNLFAVDVAQINETQEQENNNTQNYLDNLVFGSHLFGGNFIHNNQHIYNPNYKIAIGDQIAIKIWGAVNYESNLIVDSQGNIFIPQVGAIKVLGVKNKELLNIIKSNINKIYKDNVFVYADMNTYQNVSIFVTGNVNAPGLYQGLSSDSILQYLDKAKGINLEYGSFRDITILRNNKKIISFDLYDFLLNGKMDLFAFRTGDVILVNPIKDYVFVSGEVQKPYRFEIKDDIKTLKDLAKISLAKSIITNAIVKSYEKDHKINIRAYKKNEFDKIALRSGDEVEFLPDYNTQNINIQIQGEHAGLHSLVVKKGTTLQEIIDKIIPTNHSNINAIQVFRKSVAQTQKRLIQAQLKELETLALTAPSVNAESANIRVNQSKNILEFINRAKQIEPKGQIIIENTNSYKDIVLEDGDKILIPNKNNLVLVQGEVALPGAFVFVDSKRVKYYIKLAGDFSKRADKDRILVIKANGKAQKTSNSLFSSGIKIDAGDSILILPKLEGQGLVVTNMLSQILYQIAIATRVVLNI